MALIDDSAAAFAEALQVFPSTITYNGIQKPCISEPLNGGKVQDVVGYTPSVAQGVTMLKSDFDAWGDAKDFESGFSVNGGEELEFVAPTVTHPNSAVIHFILVSEK